jgi:hypothetical protein
MRMNRAAVVAGLCAGLVWSAGAWMQASQEVGNAVEVCVGPDRVLRAVEQGTPCPPGQRFLLAALTLESELKNQPTAKPPADPAVRSLEARVHQLELELQKRRDPDPANQTSQPVKSVAPGNRGTARFVVVDRAGRAILRVDEKVPVAGTAARVVIAAGDKDNFGMRVYNSGGVMTAAFGQSQDGAGLMAAYDATGKQRAVVNGLVGRISVRNADEKYVAQIGTSDDGKGEMRVFNDGELPVAMLTIGSAGAGMLQLADAGGTPTVQAGTTPNGVGVVRAGPAARAGGIGGLPGSFIMGKK